MKDINSLSHTKWNCKYHIVFAPKFRRKEFYGANRLEIGKILRELCQWKDVNIITAEVFESCAYVCRNTTKIKYIFFYGIPERKEQCNDIRKMGKYEI